MPHGDLKDLPRRKPDNNVLSDKVFNIAKNLEDDRFQRASMV